MKIDKNKVVEFSYELIVDGKVVDRMTKEKPLDYIHGTGSILPKLENTLDGLEQGARFEITLTPAEGYGEWDPKKVINVRKSAFEINGEIREDLLKVGSTVPMINGRGAVVPAIILEVSDDTVKMDFNLEMAGKTLNFTGEVISVREATEKELKEGLHGEYVHTSGCSGCHGHDGGCGDNHECNCGNSGCGCSDDGCGCGDKGCGCGDCEADCGCGCHSGDCSCEK